MKKHILLFSVVLFSCQAIAQQRLQLFPGWRVKHIGASFGTDQDMVRNLNHTYLLNTIRADDAPSISTNTFDHTTVTSMVCENPHLRLEVALLPPATRNLELRLAAVGIFNRIDEVRHYWDNNDGEYGSLAVSSIGSEVALEASLLKSATLLRSLRFYGGIGSNLGYHFDGDLFVDYHSRQWVGDPQNGGANDDPQTGNGEYVSEYHSDFYKQHNGLSQRVFGQAGFGLRFLRRVELGYEYRYGIGYRTAIGAPTKMTRLKSFALTARWLLK